MHFFIDSLLLVTQIIKGKQLYYKMWSRKSKILRIIDIYGFFTAILITYIKGGTPAHIFLCRRGLQWRRLHLLIFFTEVIKFYWLMLLLYPGELYRLLGASSLLSFHKFSYIGDHLETLKICFIHSFVSICVFSCWFHFF